MPWARSASDGSASMMRARVSSATAPVRTNPPPKRMFPTSSFRRNAASSTGSSAVGGEFRNRWMKPITSVAQDMVKALKDDSK